MNTTIIQHFQSKQPSIKERIEVDYEALVKAAKTGRIKPAAKAE